MKKLFVFDAHWSQTDIDTVIVQETCKATALARLKSLFPLAQDFSFVRESGIFME